MDSVERMGLYSYKKANKYLTKTAHNTLKTFNSVYGQETFLSSFSLVKRIRKHRILNRWLTLTANIENLNNSGARIRNYGNKFHNFYNIYGDNANDKVVKRFIKEAFPDYHELTYKYIMIGYVLEEGWEEEIVNYLKNEKIIELKDELIFILFSSKIPLDDFLELSELPISYLARLLPLEVSRNGK